MISLKILQLWPKGHQKTTGRLFQHFRGITTRSTFNVIQPENNKCNLSPRRTFAQHLYSSKKVNLVTPLFIQAQKFLDRVAIIDQHGRHTYSDLLHFTDSLSDQICAKLHASDVDGERIAFLCPNDVSYTITQWATWTAGGVAVPLSASHPTSELEYFITDSGSKLVVCTEDYADRIAAAVQSHPQVQVIVLGKQDYCSRGTTEVDVIDPTSPSAADLPNSEDARSQRHSRNNRLQQLHQHNKFKYKNAMIVYTSGTTGRPKGVLHTHRSLSAHMDGMVSAWGWSQNDVILHVLPLHHIHGIINVLMTPLYCGATCVMCVILPKFDAKKVWSMLLSPVTEKLPRSINVFMAVPTIYAKLVENYEQRLNRGRGTRQAREYVKAVCKTKIRLMVSGSAALPQPVMEKWEEITGHRLLERYGMTEIGMGLTNPLQGPRMPGSVGTPFPGVEVAIGRPNAYSKTGYDIIAQGNSRTTQITKGCDGEEGELLVRGQNLFKEYWQKPEATKDAFTTDGWFKTGDTACYRDSVYRILGRTSVDIIKSGGYKLSALDIERHLLAHTRITDVAVLGLPDITWGQKVAAVIVTSDGRDLGQSELREWAGQHMPTYQIPAVVRVLASMPRNAMGKVNKKELLVTVFENELSHGQR